MDEGEPAAQTSAFEVDSTNLVICKHKLCLIIEVLLANFEASLRGSGKQTALWQHSCNMCCRQQGLSDLAQMQRVMLVLNV